MESTKLESFLHMSQQPDAEFPDLQYSFEGQDEFCWDESLDQYIDPEQLDTGAPAPGVESVPSVDGLPELTPAPTLAESEMHGISQLLIELQNRVCFLENTITQKQITIDILERYVERLQPYLLQLSNPVQEIQMKGVA
ncbi:hypothetical protein N7532_001417 [Penicillium argentinense]|uniref:Uncharacterized protein n=1 Tax=Penicillium argentinense TaxID=1131581 RepID=A0A9W9KMG8_9EURO|nr:uncharacterized protein N7532_001417 [Penicillium argentinense]KAJ5110882.1 hypothetical protein N7532_001417 [Penicillium argentinense]